MRKVLIVVAAIAVLGAGGAAIAGAAAGGDDEGRQQAIQGAALDRATAVALRETRGGKVTETEAGDEEGAYEVEVTRADGSQVDVHLDKSFNVVEEKADHEDGAGDD